MWRHLSQQGTSHKVEHHSWEKGDTQGMLSLVASWLGALTKLAQERALPGTRKQPGAERAFQGKVLGRRKPQGHTPEFCRRHLRVLAEYWAVSTQGRTPPSLAENSYWVVELCMDILMALQCSGTLVVWRSENPKVRPQQGQVHLLVLIAHQKTS